jgi:hypothetical protein
LRKKASVARIEQSEIRVLTARLAPDFVSLNPGYACYALVDHDEKYVWQRAAIALIRFPV